MVLVENFYKNYEKSGVTWYYSTKIKGHVLQEFYKFRTISPLTRVKSKYGTWHFVYVSF